ASIVTRTAVVLSSVRTSALTYSGSLTGPASRLVTSTFATPARKGAAQTTPGARNRSSVVDVARNVANVRTRRRTEEVNRVRGRCDRPDAYITAPPGVLRWRSRTIDLISQPAGTG